ncbi:MAG: carbohydrate porin [Chthoniobacterales bacterium]
MRSRLRSAFLALFVLCAWSFPAEAQRQGLDDTGQTQDLPWLKWDYATGDWWRNRPLISDNGFDFTATYTAQVWGNVAGGLEQNAAYFGLLQFGLDIDLEKAVGWKGASFNTTWIWTMGDQITTPFVGSDFAVSGIEAPRGFRALDLWLQQKFFGDKLTLRAGMFNADRDFTISEYSSFFLNSAFGWPIIYDGRLGGQPSYPYAAPGIYAAWQPAEGWIFQTAVMQGAAYTQNANFYWNLNRMDGLIILGESIYSWRKAALPGTAKLGAIFQTGDLEVAGSDGNYAWGGGFYYGILDQALYVEPGSTEETPQGLGCFVRGGFAAPQRSSSVGFIVQSGLVYAGLLPTRDSDSVGLAFGWDQESQGEAATLTGSTRGLEMIFELSYEAQLSPWMSLQPDVQFVFQPGGSTAIPNALVLGLSLDVDF